MVGVLLDLSVTLTCGCLVPNHAVRGLGGNHGVHGACVSLLNLCCDGIETAFNFIADDLVAMMVYFLFENLLLGAFIM